MSGIGSVLDIGRWSLFASQNAVETTGNNIANVNTEGYSRREVVFDEAPSVDFAPGQLGQGVRATEVVRIFDQFIESQYTTKLADQERWSVLHENLQSVETLFTNSEESGLSQAMQEFWKQWQDLAQRPEDGSTRAALLGKTQNMLNAIQITDTDMDNLQTQVEDFIQQDVDDVNSLIKQLADLNVKITEHTIEGQNNPNELLDQRNSLLRDLAEKIDINVIDNGLGDMIVTTRGGHTLVDGGEYFKIAFEGPQSFKALTPSSTFDGDIDFSGSSSYEYTFEVVSGGSVGGASPATLKISIDGGRTWRKDSTGNLITVEAQDSDNKVNVPDSDLDIWFTGSTNLAVGDRFDVVPKKGLYWYQTTSSKLNITPMVQSNGEDDTTRLVGGSIAGEFGFRDNYIGGYREKLDALSQGLIWEVNRLHSQGMGLSKFTDLTGTYGVDLTNAALGGDTSGLFFSSKLSSGNISFYVYDKNSGQLVTDGQFLDFDTTTSGIQNFDPTTNSLEDVRDAIDNLDHISATIENGKLRITADSGYEFGFGSDSTGLLAGLGLNTFFDGFDAGSISVNAMVNNNLNYISSGHINGQGEINLGDNQVAQAIADLQYQEVELTTKQEGTTTQTLQNYYNSLTANVGADAVDANYNYTFYKALADDLDERQKSVAGVNLDEEMSNLIKFQQAYTAAAKLITTAEEMMQTVLGMKQ